MNPLTPRVNAAHPSLLICETRVVSSRGAWKEKRCFRKADAMHILRTTATTRGTIVVASHMLCFAPLTWVANRWRPNSWHGDCTPEAEGLGRCRRRQVRGKERPNPLWQAPAAARRQMSTLLLPNIQQVNAEAISSACDAVFWVSLLIQAYEIYLW
jgi:hypothetical protein